MLSFPKRILALSAFFFLALTGLCTNAWVVSRQQAEATGDSIVPLKGGNIHVSQDGQSDAPALVLIHGLGASTHWWDALVPLLTGRYRVIRIDLLGHGQSAKPAGDGYAIPEQAHRVAETLDRLSIKSAILVGHSSGGSVATALAEQRPDLVAGIVLIDSGPRLDAFISDGPVGKLVFVPLVGQLLWRLRTNALVRRSMSTAFSRPGYELPQQLVDDARSTTHHALTTTALAVEEYMAQRTLPERLKPLGKPLLSIFGEEDRRWRSASAAEYSTVPGARVELLPGVGHSPMLEAPQETAELLLAFAAPLAAPAKRSTH